MGNKQPLGAPRTPNGQFKEVREALMKSARADGEGFWLSRKC